MLPLFPHLFAMKSWVNCLADTKAYTNTEKFNNTTRSTNRQVFSGNDQERKKATKIENKRKTITTNSTKNKKDYKGLLGKVVCQQIR